MKYINRQLVSTLNQLIQQYPILAVTGPRQSGKTTLIRTILKEYQYVSLEDLDNRSFAREDPGGFLDRYDTKVIIDEAQRVPKLFSYLQTRVDDAQIMGQYILSGSQNFHLMDSISQSLSGRVGILKLMPFDTYELSQEKLLSKDWKSQLLKGFYPRIYARKINYSVFYSNYIQTYIDRDVRSLTNVHDLGLFRKFIHLCAGRIGQLLNLNSLANKCGITSPTAKKWLSILETSYIIYLLPPYHENFNKRIVKSPKLYFYDTGLASFLLGHRKISDLHDLSALGNLFENFIIGDIIKKNYHQNTLHEYWFWRDSNGHEIDLLTINSGKYDITEIKMTTTITAKVFKGLKYFDKISDGKVGNQTLIYGGDDNYTRSGYDIRSWA